MNTTKKIALFEPWGLGDLAISLQLARNAANRGLTTTLLCDPRYAEWARTFPFIEETIGISVPWTRKEKKYPLPNYPWNEWRSLRKRFGKQRFESIIEPRRDLRASLLLRYLFSAPQMRPLSRSGGVGYQRLEILAPLKPESITHEGSAPSFVCFFGAEWRNRRVPEWKFSSLLKILGKASSRVAVIIPPEESKSPFYRSLTETGVESIEGSVAEVAKKVSSFSHCISTDSGWLHVARLYGLKTMGLFGFDSVGEWSPPDSAFLRSEHCLPAPARYSKPCEGIQPLGTLRADLFEKAIERL